MKIPYEWKATLDYIREHCPEAVIGGGCLRDLDNGREIKDIDIFVSGSRMQHLEDLHKKLTHDGACEVSDIDYDQVYPVGEGNDVVGHFEVEFEDITEPVQIIMVNFDCSKITDRFDYGICRISYDGQNVYRSPDYEADKRDQVFRLCLQRCGQGLASSVHRYARLVRKYEGWRFVPYDTFNDVCPT